jgi:hypothetical protein
MSYIRIVGASMILVPAIIFIIYASYMVAKDDIRNFLIVLFVLLWVSLSLFFMVAGSIIK